MNYTGNPRHLREGQHSRSFRKAPRPRHRGPTPAILERPWLDICGSFQKQTDGSTARPTGGVAATSAVVPSTTISSMEDARDCFQAKRRRLLEQSDWLGLDLTAPINIYELRAAKEQKRRAGGPFVRPLFSQPSNSSTASPPPRTTPSLPSRSPAPTSQSSISLLPQASNPSIYSSQPGSAAFVPSHCTTPVNTNPVTSPSNSACSSSHCWNNFVKPSTPSVSDLGFIPEKKVDAGFFPWKLEEKDTADMRKIWTMIEERKREDNLLRKELGWESQSGVSASQVSVQQSQQMFYQSQHQVVRMENGGVTDNMGAEGHSAAVATVVSCNGMAIGEKTMVLGDAGSKEVASVTEQDEEDDEVGVPWF